MEIPHYKSFEEKAEHFKTIKIDNIADFKSIYESQSILNGVYRGVNNSSFKIYSSKQREFFLNSTNKDYLTKLKKSKYIKEYFERAKIPQTDLSFYSILQHYGKPTPLIDFTNKFEVALFFASDNLTIPARNNVNELNNYFSLFFISDIDLQMIDASIQLRGFSEYNKIANINFKKYEDYSEAKVLEGTNRLFKINSLDVYYLKHEERYSKLVNINSNHRILMQDGVFLFNKFKNFPLEEALKLFLEDEIEISRYTPWDDMDWNRPDVQEAQRQNQAYLENLRKKQIRLKENIITSFDINKLLIPEIQNIISIPEKDYIYFDIDKEMMNL